MNTLAINLGSSSIKFKLFADGTILVDAVVEHIGEKAELKVHHSEIAGITSRNLIAITTGQAGAEIQQLLTGITIDRVVHRIVHGGRYIAPTLATKQVIEYLHRITHLAPLHLPASLEIVELFSSKQTILCFDTMFHATLPHQAKCYAIPQELAQKHDIHRTGFHGLAHESLARHAAFMLKKPLAGLRIITCQLGNGASMCAVQNGISIDTSMGFSPLEGLVMGTRCGDIDVSIIPFLCEREGLTLAQVYDMLEHKSGLLALGGSADMRTLLDRDDQAAHLAIAVYIHRIRKYLGAYIVALGGVDAIVLGGGTSQSPVIRAKIFDGLDELGISLDKRALNHDAPVQISSGKIKILVLNTDEEEQMILLAKRYFG